jgi:acyl carrier protein
MTRTEIFEKIQNTLADEFEIDRSKITLESHLIKDLGMDSLDAIQMAVHIQELTKERVPEEDLRQLRTVKDTIDMIERLLAKSA